jgi:hypothetical protein
MNMVGKGSKHKVAESNSFHSSNGNSPSDAMADK